MDDAEIEKRIRSFIESDLMKEPPATPLTKDVSLIDTGIIDSLGLFKLVAFLEEAFQVSVEPDQVRADNFETLEKVLNLVKRKTTRESAS